MLAAPKLGRLITVLKVFVLPELHIFYLWPRPVVLLLLYIVMLPGQV